MTDEENQLLIEHARAMPAAGYAYAKILYKNAPVEELTSLGKIEEVVRSQMQEHVMPEVGVFLSKMSQEKAQDASDS
jgi:hypothetical protein